jgi:hypothetical protein
MRALRLVSLLAFTGCLGNTGRPADSASKGKVDGSFTCPLADGDAESISGAIEGAGSCYTATGIAEACAYGSSLDVQFVASATAICDRGFGAMTAAHKAAYESLLGQCGAKYENESGTLYRSMAAFCTLEVVRLFNHLYPEPEYGDDLVSYAADCPVAGTDPDKIEGAIRAASSCSSAADIAGACAWGSSIDTQFAAAAGEVCSAETGELGSADAALHGQLIEACNALYTEGSGTLQLSVAAMCRVQVDVVFNGLAGEVE